jgi:hypothetical protein
MGTFAATDAELAAALTAAGVRVAAELGATEPPCAVLFSDGSELAGLGRGQVPWRWRVTLLAGRIDAAAVQSELATVRGTVLSALRSLAGWRLVSVSRDGIREVGGGQLLACDVITERMIEL